MTTRVGNYLSATASNQWNALLPEATGVDRLQLVFCFTERTGQGVDQVPSTFNMNGVAYQLVCSQNVISTLLRAVTVFAAKESDIVSVLAGSGGFTGVDAVSANYHNAGGNYALSATFQGVDQSLNLTTLFAQAGPFATNGGDPLPHEIGVSATNGDLIVVGGLGSQPDTVTWTNATEFADVNTTANVISLAQKAVTATGTETIGFSPDAGLSYATLLTGIKLRSAGGANSDPALDTPQADISVPANTSGVIANISGNWSDADGDTLTYSVTPALPAGMTLNTTTGDISGNAAITITGAANYTFTADDGQGGTPATDVVSIEVTAVVNAGLRLTLRDAENSNALIASETGLTVHVYDTDGGTELLTTTAETTDASGVLEIDSDSIGNVDDTAFIVAKRSNGQTCCGTVTVIDLDA